MMDPIQALLQDDLANQDKKLIDKLIESGARGIQLHKNQTSMYKDLFINKIARFIVGVCARGWGKSFFMAAAAWTATRELMALPSHVPNKNVFIVMPTHDQAKDIYFPLLAHIMGLTAYALDYSRDRGYFEFPRNTWLRLVSYEAVERMRGKGAYFIGIDEPSSYVKGIGLQAAWEQILEPCIRTRWSPEFAKHVGAPSPGRAAVVGTPKGYNYLYNLFHFAENDNEWKSYHYDYTKSKYLSKTEIEKVKHRIDPIEWASEYLAQFKDSGFSVFYNFDRKKHVRADISYFQEGEVANVGIDFNVGIMAASAFAERANQMQYIEDFKGSPNTPSLIEVLKSRYGDRRIVAFPDPTGNSAKTSAAIGSSDLSLLRQAGITVCARSASPGIVDSVQAVNRKLLTQSGDITMFFHPAAVDTINSMERTVWLDRNSDSMVIDKSDGVEHWSDQVRYATEFKYPVNRGTTQAKKSNMF
jgi:hypothetical protein